MKPICAVMITRIHHVEHFPEVCPNFYLEEFSSQFGDCSLIVNAQARQVEYPTHWGVLSIKCAFNGSEYYKSGNGLYAVTDNNYLLLNEGTYRSSYIHSPTLVHSFSISFSPKLVGSFLYSFLSSNHQLLDNPFFTASEGFRYTEKLYDHDEAVSPIIQQIIQLCREWDSNQGLIEEQLTFLLEAMTFKQERVWSTMRTIRAMKLSTQKELYERVHRAKDYISSCYSENITLEDMAEVACLNPHYFLREFKKIVAITPHQWLQQERLKQAALLLEKTDLPISQVCQEVGFGDASSFCKLFKRTFGKTPGEYRVGR